MAGIGEACAHVPAGLFNLETTSRIDGMSLGIKEQCPCIIPAYQRNPVSSYL